MVQSSAEIGMHRDSWHQMNKSHCFCARGEAKCACGMATRLLRAFKGGCRRKHDMVAREAEVATHVKESAIAVRMSPLECRLDRHDRRTWGRKMVWSRQDELCAMAARQGPLGFLPRGGRSVCVVSVQLSFAV